MADENKGTAGCLKEENKSHSFSNESSVIEDTASTNENGSVTIDPKSQDSLNKNIECGPDTNLNSAGDELVLETLHLKDSEKVNTVSTEPCLTPAQKEFENAMDIYSDVDNYVELELDSSSSSNSSVSIGELGDRNSALYIHNNLLLNADFLTDFDIDPFDVEFMLENHGGHAHLLNLINLASSADPRPSLPPYPCSEITNAECSVCFDERSLRKRLCCELPVCDECLESYLVSQINVGNVQLRCPSTECNIYIHRDEVLARLPVETKEKYYRFLVDANNDPNVKTCPRCSYIHKFEARNIPKPKNKKKTKKSKYDTSVQVICPDCKLSWCFSCQAPWHENATCKDFRKGDKLLKSWAQEYRYGQNNAQKCPHCKVYIEKKGGCDHMTCIHCGTSFCYRCGERYMRLKFLGNHTSRLSPFGCRYNFMPDRPGARRAIRGSVLGAKLLGGVLLGAFIVGAGALFVGCSFIILPAYGGYRYYKSRQRRKWIKRHRKLWPELQKRPRILRDDAPAGTDEAGDKVPPFGITREENESGSRGSTSSDDTISNSGEDIVAVGIQGDGSQEVQVLVHAQDQQGEGKNQDIDRSEVKDQIQVTSEASGKVHVTTIEVKKDEGDENAPVVLQVTTTSKDDSVSGNKQSGNMLQKDPALSRDTTPDADKEVSSTSTLPNPKTSDSEGNDAGTTTQEPEKKCKHKNELKSKGDEADESSFVIEEGNAETKGCFVRIFGKKLPVVWDKDKDGEKITEKEVKHQKDGGLTTLEKIPADGSLKRKKSSNINSKSIKNQPDIVNCALISEHKQKLMSLGKDSTIPDSDNVSHGESCDREEQKDPYYGLISADTCETPL